MPKINQEEYEVLKALDSRAKSIVRQARGWLWVAEQPMMKDRMSWFVADGFDEVLKDDNLFHFIQWEDEEPYNIAELIEEYEIENGMRYDFGKIKVVDIDTSKLATHNGYIYVKESEETEVKKGIEWLKKEIGELPCVDTVFNSDGSSYIDSAVPVMAVYDLIDKIDEPEVLSQEWIDERKGYVREYNIGHYIQVEHLQNLLVPKQEITFDQVHDKLREESILSEKSFDYYWNCINDNVEIDEPGNLIVPKQELPVIPKYVGDWIECIKPNTSLRAAFEYIAKREADNYDDPLAFWVGEGNSETFARAWLDGYEVEEERYVIKLPMPTSRDMDFALVDYKGDIWIDAWPNKYELTEQEIRALPKGDVYFEYFAEPVEELEE